MKWWRWVLRRMGVVFDKDGIEDDLDDEIRFHLEMESRQHERAGLSPREARRRALVAFGGVERYKEQVRDVRGARGLDDLIQDTRVALRSLPKRPTFVVAVVLTLAIGIGGNVAMFGVVEATLFGALPFPDADRLVLGRVTFEGEVGNTVSGPDYFDYRDQTTSFDGLGALTPFEVNVTLTGTGQPERIRSPLVSTDLFTTLGVDPVIGRHFLSAEGELGAPDVVMLSHGLWERNFGADPGIIDRSVTLGGTPATVVGVMPPGFRFIVDADVWRPIQRGGSFAGARQFHNFVLVGRLSDAVSMEAAQAEVDAISARLAELYPDTNRDKGLRLTDLREALSEGFRLMLTMLTGAVAALLLIACANVAGLLLARGNARRSEMAVRSAMGAGRGRLARQLLTENALLALAAGAAGIVLAAWLQQAILAFLPLGRFGSIDPGLSPEMLLFAILLSAVTVAVFGVVPSLRVARTDPAADLRSGARTGVARSAARFRNALVVGQVTMTAILLAVSGLLLRSFAELRSVELGFQAEGLVTAEIQLPSGSYQGAEPRVQFFTELQTSLESLPEALSVGLVSHLPVRDRGGNLRVDVPERFGSEGVLGLLAYARGVMPGYFEAMGIPVLAGRDVALSDAAGAVDAVLVSRSLAERLFGEEDPLGRILSIDDGGDEPALRQVVGVVGDVVASSLAEGADYAMYFPYPQYPATQMRVAIRPRGEATRLVPALREAVSALDSDIPVAAVATMDDVIARSISGRKAVAVLLVTFAGVALLLAGVGLYGVLAFQVSRRLHEIGVCMALGASTRTVTRGVVKDGVALTLVGLGLAIPGAYLSGRLLRGLLFEVGSADPITYVGVTLFLGSVAVVACALPAMRAARVDPVEAFRSE